MPSWFVYILRSLSCKFVYIGSTNDVRRRLSEHNDGRVQSTKAYRPLEIKAYVAVETEQHARRLEKYFKTGSGKAVLRKRLLTDEAGGVVSILTDKADLKSGRSMTDEADFPA